MAKEITAPELKALAAAYKNAEPVIESAASFPQGDTKRSSAGGGGDNGAQGALPGVVSGPLCEGEMK